MLVALDRTLELVAPLLPPALVCQDTLGTLAAVAGDLPAVASGGAVECRLGPSSRVDLLMYMVAEEGGHRVLLRQSAEDRSAVLRAPAWRGVLDFCAAWAEPASILHAGVPVFWLEFDVEAGATIAPAPLPFPCVERHLLEKSPPEEQDGAERAGCLEVIGQASALLLGRPLARATSMAMARCVERLPANGRALHVAPLATRGRDAIRLVVSVPRDEVLEYLDRIEWPGSKEEIGELVAAMFTSARRVALHLDVTTGVEPILGLELFHPPGDPRWEPLMDELVRRGACTSDKRDALLQWPKSARVCPPHHRWPSQIETTILVKLVSKPGEPLEAKAYLGFTSRHPLLG
jgi:hypothetical protein